MVRYVKNEGRPALGFAVESEESDESSDDEDESSNDDVAEHVAELDESQVNERPAKRSRQA